MREDGGAVTTTETVSESDTVELPAALGSDRAARLHLAVAPILGFLGLLLYTAVAIKLIDPAFLAGSEALSYGRLFPVATNVLLWSWLTPALLGATFYMVPRIAGRPLQGGPLALVSLPLVVGGSVAGSVAVALGETAGGRFLELPPWADAVVAVGVLTAAVAVTLTARSGDRDRLPVAQWYFVGATWWLFFSVVTGAAVPLIGGLGAALTGWFSVTATIGLWLAAAGIGTAYYLVQVLVPDARFHPRLGRIGFWTMAFAWAWTAPRVFQYGPTPDWLETTPIVFSLALVVGVATLLADFSHALTGKWSAVGDSTSLKFVVIGLGLFALLPLHMLVQSFPGASTVVHFTAWETAFEQLVLFGPFAFLAMAATYHVASASTGKVAGGLARAHLWVGLIGVLTVAASRWIAGLQQGYTWIAAVNSREFANSGPGYRNSVAPLEAAQWMQVIGLGIIAAAFLAFFAARLRLGFGTGGDGDSAWESPADDEPVQRFSIVAQGAVILFVIALLGVVVLPLSDAETDPSILAYDSRGVPAQSVEAKGRDLYIREGCWYCHTQQVRAAVPDVGLGTVSVAGDYAYEEADVTGLERIGPDLAHVGTRFVEDPAWSVISPAAYLTDPDSGRSWSRMPSYDHLSDAEIDALVAYLATLE